MAQPSCPPLYSPARAAGEVLIMGGAFGLRRGNRTPTAEANFFDGPEAAQAGIGLGWVWGGICKRLRG